MREARQGNCVKLGVAGGVAYGIKRSKSLSLVVCGEVDPRGLQLDIGADMALWMAHPKRQEPLAIATNDARLVRKLEDGLGGKHFGHNHTLRA